MRKWFGLGLLSAFFQVQAASVSFVDTDNALSDLAIGDVFSLTIVGSDFDFILDGGGLDLSFDAGVLAVNSVTVDPMWSLFSLPGSVDNTAGAVEGIVFNQFVFSPIENFSIATIEFTAVAAGTSLLGLSEYLLNPFVSGFDVGADVLGIDLQQNFAVTVQAVPLPASAWLLLSGVGLLMTRCRKAKNC